MRERVQLIRVRHPHLGSHEADLVPVFSKSPVTDVSPSPSDEPPALETASGYIAYLLIQSEAPKPEVGERIILRWGEGEQMRGRGVITQVTPEQQEGDDTSWLTFKLLIELQARSADLRHYPRLLGGVQLWYAPMERIVEGEAWLSESASADTLNKDARFETPLDPLMNFSVSGLSFEARAPQDLSHLILCAVGIGEGDASLYRCLGKVVRSAPESDHFSIAIHFVSPPPTLVQALSELTLRIQRLQTERGEEISLPLSAERPASHESELRELGIEHLDLDALDIDERALEELTREALALDLSEIETEMSDDE